MKKLITLVLLLVSCGGMVEGSSSPGEDDAHPVSTSSEGSASSSTFTPPPDAGCAQTAELPSGRATFVCTFPAYQERWVCPSLAATAILRSELTCVVGVYLADGEDRILCCEER